MNALWKFRAMFWRYKGRILLGVAAILAINALAAAIPWQIKRAIEQLENVGGQTTLNAEFYEILAQTAVISVGMFVARVCSRIWLLGAGRKIEYDLRNRLFEHLLTMPPAYFAANPTGQLMSRLTSDVEATRYLIGGGLMMGFNTLFAYLTTLPALWMISPTLMGLAFLIYPFVIWAMTGVSRRVRTASYEVQQELGDISALAQENFIGMPVIQSYVREAAENRHFQKLCDRYYNVYQALIKHRLVLFMLLAALSGVSFLIVLSGGGWQVIAGQMKLADFMAFALYLERLAWPTLAMGWTLSIVQQGMAALDRIDEVLATEPAIPPPAAVPAETRNTGQLEVRNLSFRYDNPYVQGDENAPLALQDVSLTIPAGQFVAFVGPVGAGKSTLLRLLPRLQPVPEGAIFLDGRDITTLDVGALRKQVVLMPQQSFLFSTTVAQNIAFAQEQAMDALTETSLTTYVLPAAQVAHIHEEIERLPQQYQTLVGERGLMLSGGQRQRVALARAVMLEAPVLILDDPFSNIDSETEQGILSALQARKRQSQRTTLVATHRFSLVRQADWVVLMDAGHIVATGTHEELLRTQPLYQRLNRIETLREELGGFFGEVEAS